MAQKDQKEIDPRQQRFYCKVYHLSADSGSRDAVIPVNDLGDIRHGRAACVPGKRTILSKVQIGILKEAVVRHKLPVPEDSGIYGEPDPLKAAEKQFPKFHAIYDRNTGQIFLEKIEPRFSVEIIEPFKG